MSFPIVRIFRSRPPWRPPAPSADRRHLRRGTRALADLIAPAAVQLAPDHLQLERQYVRVLAVTGYPRTVSPGWLRPLLDHTDPLEVSLHVTPLASETVIATLTHRLAGLESSRSLAAQQGRLVDHQQQTAAADVDQLRQKLQRRTERVFAVALYVAVRAESREALERRSRRLERLLAGMLAHCRLAAFQQDRGFHACLPEGQDELGVRHTLDTSSLATMVPFAAHPLAMPTGVLYGVATDSHAPVLVDPFDPSLENANLAIFATSGAGKSYFTKLLLLRTLLQGTAAIIIDPEDEYRALCRAVDGQELRLAGASSQRLNPFDLPPLPAAGDGPGQDPLDEQVAALVGLAEVLLAEPGRPLGPAERGVLDRTLYQTYATAHIQRGRPDTYAQPAPLLRDLYALLLQADDPLARSLADRLQRYAQGSLAGLFAGPTNVALERQCVVFSLQALEPELRPLGIHLITSFIWNQVRRARRARLLVIDEAWSLLQHEAGARFLGSLARRARKYHLGLVTITQDVADALDHPQGRTVLATAASTLLLKQSAATIGPLVEAYGLSPEERQYLLGAAPGEGLLSCRGARLPLRILASPGEHALATTAPRDLAAQAAAQQAMGDLGGQPAATPAPQRWRQGDRPSGGRSEGSSWQ
jgi:conjugal transfer ATP-binding protein TraC